MRELTLEIIVLTILMTAGSGKYSWTTTHAVSGFNSLAACEGAKASYLSNMTKLHNMSGLRPMPVKVSGICSKLGAGPASAPAVAQPMAPE